MDVLILEDVLFRSLKCFKCKPGIKKMQTSAFLFYKGTTCDFGLLACMFFNVLKIGLFYVFLDPEIPKQKSLR